MNYEKPIIIQTASPIDAVRNSMAKMDGLEEPTDLITVSAYESDER